MYKYQGCLNQNCAKCGKKITDEEWVVNWTSCSDCFDKDYEEYLKNNGSVAQ